MTPFEELEFLADYLPDEGEAVILSRRRGELVCEVVGDANEKNTTTEPAPKVKGISDASLYGRLLQASERLKSCTTSNVWMWILACYGVCVGMHLVTGFGWEGWYFDLGIVLIVFCLATFWSQFQQWQLFTRDIFPMLEQVMLEHQIDRFELITRMKQHRDLSSLLASVLRWTR